MEKGLGDAVLEAVSLEDNHSPDHMASASRPKNSILVDLAVVEQDIPRVQRYFSCVESPVNDLSLVIIANDSTDPERQRWLRYLWVYSKYLNAQAKRSGNASRLGLEWYKLRLEEISSAIMQIYSADGEP